MSHNRYVNSKKKLSAVELAAAIEHIASSSDDGSDISDFDSSDDSSSEGENNDGVEDDGEGDGSDDDDDSDATVEYYHDEDDFHWNNAPQQVQQQLPFTGTPGINVQISAPDDPLEYFELFVTDDIVQSIVTEN